MKKWQLISLLIFVYVIGLVVLLPARFVVAMAPLPSNVQLGTIDGSIWRGSIERVVVSNVADNDINLYDVDWQLSPLSLLVLNAEVIVNVPAQARNFVQGELTITANRNELRVSNARFAADLEDLLGFSPVVSPIPLRGGFSLNVREFVLGQPICSVMNGQALGMQVNGQFGAEWQNLGDYETALGCTNGRLELNMPHDNLLGLSVTGSVAPTGIDLRIGIAPTPQAPQGIRDLVEWFGQPDSQGRRYFTFRL